MSRAAGIWFSRGRNHKGLEFALFLNGGQDKNLTNTNKIRQISLSFSFFFLFLTST